MSELSLLLDGADIAVQHVLAVSPSNRRAKTLLHDINTLRDEDKALAEVQADTLKQSRAIVNEMHDILAAMTPTDTTKDPT